MAKTEKPVHAERIPCAVCLREVAQSEAVVREAADYFVYFCGLDGYKRWKSDGGKPDDTEEKSAP